MRPPLSFAFERHGISTRPGKAYAPCGPASAAGGLGEIVDRLYQLRFRRIGVDIEDEDLAGIETGEPELAAIVSESAVMRLVASLDGNAVDDFAVVRRAGLYIDGNKFVRAIAQTFDTERPDINELLLPVDAGKIR